MNRVCFALSSKAASATITTMSRLWHRVRACRFDIERLRAYVRWLTDIWPCSSKRHCRPSRRKSAAGQAIVSSIFEVRARHIDRSGTACTHSTARTTGGPAAASAPYSYRAYMLGRRINTAPFALGSDASIIALAENKNSK